MECILLHMAGPIGHVVYAQKVYGSLDHELDKAGFIIGTLFPDIRALGVIDRKKTHPTGVTYAQVIQEKDAFTCGLLLHALIDELREAYVVEWGVYTDLPSGYPTTVALKICEDMALYPRVADWNEYASYLQTILPQEEAMGVGAQAIQKWHSLLQRFMAAEPAKGLSEYLYGIGGPEARQDIDHLMELVRTIQERKLVDTYIFDFYDELSGLLQAR